MKHFALLTVLAAPLLAHIAADPKSPNAYLQLAASYRRADRLDQAKAILEQGLASTGNHFELALELAEIDIEPFRRDGNQAVVHFGDLGHRIQGSEVG